MGEEYVARIIVFGGMVHGIAVSRFFMVAIAHAKEAVALGKQGHAAPVAEYAEQSRNHAERGGRNSHLAEGIKHLTEAVELGKAGHVDTATERAEAALGHLLEVRF